MNYYRRYMGDYNSKTAALSLAEHGAYNVLLDTCYSTENPLPAEVDALCRICRAMSRIEQVAVKSVADRFFPIGKDGLRHNRRADEEIAKAQLTIAKQRESGVESAAKRWSTDGSTHESTNRSAIQPPTSNLQPLTPNPQPPEKTKTARKKHALAPVPEGWKPSEKTAEKLIQEFSLPEGGIERYTIAFLDICASKGHEYANIDAGFSNCVRQDWPKFRANGLLKPRQKTAAELLDEAEAARKQQPVSLQVAA